MAAGWKKILLEGDAAAPSDEDPHDIGTTAAEGVAADCSRHDHVHVIGAGAINAANMLANDIVEAAALDDDGVFTIGRLIVAGADPLSEILLTPKSTCATPAVGIIYFDTEDDHPKVYVASV